MNIYYYELPVVEKGLGYRNNANLRWDSCDDTLGRKFPFTSFERFAALKRDAFSAHVDVIFFTDFSEKKTTRTKVRIWIDLILFNPVYKSIWLKRLVCTFKIIK